MCVIWLDFDMIDADGDGQISREEWRKWADEKMTMLVTLNQERMQIVSENRRLRQALRFLIFQSQFIQFETKK